MAKYTIPLSENQDKALTYLKSQNNQETDQAMIEKIVVDMLENAIYKRYKQVKSSNVLKTFDEQIAVIESKGGFIITVDE